MAWYECASQTVEKVVSGNGVSYICSNVNGTFAWKEIFDLKLFVIGLALLFFLFLVLKRLGVIKSKPKRKTRRK